MATFFRTPWKAHESYGDNPPPIPKPDRRKMPRPSRAGKKFGDRRGPSAGSSAAPFAQGGSSTRSARPPVDSARFAPSDAHYVPRTERPAGSYSRGPAAAGATRAPYGASRSAGPRAPYSGASRGYQGSNPRSGAGARSWSPERDSRGGSRGNYSDRGGSRGGSRGGRNNRNPGESINPARFINKAVIGAEPEPVFVPQHQFSDFPMQQRIKDNLSEKGYVTPTPIQDQAIPAVLEGRDIVGLANTGTGKTGAFLIPLINRAFEDRDVRVLIMAPTRELAVQIADEFKGFSRALSMSAALCVGGAGIYPQVSALKHRPQFVIGTPGRLKDLAERRALDFSDFTTVVLDEADRMLDMGFIDDMRFILAKLPEGRHTLFFSATMSREIEKMISEFLTDPITVSVRKGETSSTIDQDVIRLAPGQNKFEVLVKMLADPDMSKVLVFGRTKHGVERLAKDLNRSGIKAEDIHGNKTHGRRLRALDAFKADRVQVLVATDVAARGLDISGVSHVINFDLPSSYDDYVHRIGRTGRAGKTGKALTFIG